MGAAILTLGGAGAELLLVGGTPGEISVQQKPGLRQMLLRGLGLEEGNHGLYLRKCEFGVKRSGNTGKEAVPFLIDRSLDSASGSNLTV